MNNEEELFNYLKEYHFPDLEKYDDKFSYSDCFTKYKEIELKCRSKHYEHFYIEYVKYNCLVNRALKNDRIHYYICSSPRGVYAWNLLGRPLVWFERENLPVTTEFENNERITKKVAGLLVYEAITLKENKEI